MFIVISLMLMGVLIGFLLRKHPLKHLNAIITVLIWLLLFLLGINVGGNRTLIDSLHHLGMEALFITLGGTLGSILAASALWHIIRKKEQK